MREVQECDQSMTRAMANFGDSANDCPQKKGGCVLLQMWYRRGSRQNGGSLNSTNPEMSLAGLRAKLQKLLGSVAVNLDGIHP